MERTPEPHIDPLKQPLPETVEELQKLDPEFREVGETEVRQTISDKEKVDAEEDGDIA